MHRNLLLCSVAPVVCALLSTPAFAQALPVDAKADGSGATQDIVVTAQKRGAETLLTVPVPVGVLDSSQLAQHEQVKFQDYASEVPGFTVNPSTANQSALTIRGINTGGQGGGPTVGITLDDVPFIASGYQPEIDPGELERIEVLRGPQGTLYGVSAMGGLIRFVTKQPSTNALSGQITAGLSNVAHGGDMGYSIRGSLNVPLSDTVAARISGFRRLEPGYIRNVLTGARGINEARADGGRAAILFRPSTTFSVELTGLIQTITNDADDQVTPSIGLHATSAARGSTASKITTRSFSALVNAQLGKVKLTSITGYNTLDNISSSDFTPTFGPILAARFRVAPYADVITPGSLKAVTQELRLDTTIADRLDVELAGFYSHNADRGGLTIAPPDPQTGLIVIPLNAFNTFSSVTHRHEYAVFGSLTYHFTDRLELEVGARESHRFDKIEPYFRYGNFNTPNPLLVVGSVSKSTPFTFLVTPRFQVTPNFMVYARAASGYRQGGANTSPGAPPQYDPDKTYNYEVGLKGKFLDGKLTTDLSVYHIDWKQIQLQQRTALNFLYTSNGGAAKSEGVEFTMTAKPLRNTTITGWLDYDNAVLTVDFVPTNPNYGKRGDALPNTPKWSGHLALRQSATLREGVTGFVEAEGNYVDQRVGIFQATALRQVFPSYTQVNLRAGVDTKQLSFNVYVNNISDRRALLNGGIGFGNANNFVYIRPRTIGGSITARF